MESDEMKAYWNYSRVVKTIPEKDFNRPDVQQTLMAYGCLEAMFLEEMARANSMGGMDVRSDV